MQSLFLGSTIAKFEDLRKQGMKTLEQINDDQLHWTPDPESNSIAIIVKHMHGNMISRFTDFLTTDGEKPTRDRDGEFIEERMTVTDAKRLWQEGWDCVLNAIRPLHEDDEARIVLIRGEEHTVIEALVRQISHYGYHVGQMVYIAKHLTGPTWKTLTIPRGESKKYLAVPFSASDRPR